MQQHKYFEYRIMYIVMQYICMPVCVKGTPVKLRTLPASVITAGSDGLRNPGMYVCAWPTELTAPCSSSEWYHSASFRSAMECECVCACTHGLTCAHGLLHYIHVKLLSSEMGK